MFVLGKHFRPSNGISPLQMRMSVTRSVMPVGWLVAVIRSVGFITVTVFCVAQIGAVELRQKVCPIGKRYMTQIGIQDWVEGRSDLYSVAL